ncbi:Uncharacterised protein [Klebsiella pneumoniae]|nr:Uncharacterised protein [Klebsiella pneumoniae]
MDKRKKGAAWGAVFKSVCCMLKASWLNFQKACSGDRPSVFNCWNSSGWASKYSSLPE